MRSGLIGGLVAIGGVVVALAVSAQQRVPGEQFMAMWDADADGVVTTAEAQARREMIFDMFDAEGDGILSPDDYADIDAHMAEDAQRRAEMGAGRGQMADRMQAGWSVAANDADGDGLVSLQEFRDATPQWLAGMDANEDGVVTRADFGQVRQPGRGRNAGQGGSGG